MLSPSSIDPVGMDPTAARPWHPIPIVENGEPLLTLPPQLWRLEPHPYVALGAPYGPGQSPFQLRSGVVEALQQAQQLLQEQAPRWRLAIFDGWRPLAVQRFMVEHTVAQQCQVQGVDAAIASPSLEAIVNEVGRFWAAPSPNPCSPPPHSTGAAVDLTLATAGGEPLAMGGEIDAIGPISEPDHYGTLAELDPSGAEASWHHRRQVLAAVMGAAGFAQHPNEWWHFSLGDQLWAWRSGHASAHYGRIGQEGLD